MVAQHGLTRTVIAAALVLAGAFAIAQSTSDTGPAVIPRDGISDIGSFEAVPFGGAGQLFLKPEDKAVVRKLEDKHIQELRALEDRYEKDLRTLRAKQYAEREQLLKAIARK